MMLRIASNQLIVPCSIAEVGVDDALVMDTKEKFKRSCFS